MDDKNKILSRRPEGKSKDVTHVESQQGMEIEVPLECNEPALLTLAIGLFAIRNPHLNPHQGLAEIVGVSRTSLDKFASGQGYLGGEAWVRIERELSYPIYRTWLLHKSIGGL